MFVPGQKCLAAALSVALLLLGTAACSQRDVSDQHYINNYKTAIASASADHYTPYWLGYGFTARGLQFQGPSTGDFAYEVPGGGVTTDYSGGGAALLMLTSYSPGAWAMWRAQHPHANDNVTQVPVTAGARHGTLLRIPLRGRPNLLQVVFELGETTVVASTYVDAAHPDATPNPNPLVDEQTLISVLSNLRPYPQ